MEEIRIKSGSRIGKSGSEGIMTIMPSVYYVNL